MDVKIMFRFTKLALVFALAGQISGFASTAPSDSEAAKTKARSLAQAVQERHKLPGLSVAIASRGELLWSEQFGQADIELDVPVTPATRFRLGSVSKLITVAAVARLVDQGKLDLDRPIRDYVSYFPRKKWPITTRQLAAHTGGIRHYDQSDPINVPKHYTSVREGIAIFQDSPLLFQPGSSYQYSSYGYNLISAVVEGASGMRFVDFVQKEVFDEVGMENSSPDNHYLLIPNRTSFYWEYDGQIKSDDASPGDIVNAPVVDNSYKWASGGLLSTPEDMVRFVQAHFEGDFLSDPIRKELFTPAPNTDNGSFAVGVGWRITRDDEGRVYYHHGGAIAGGRAFVLAYPDTQTIVVLLSNLFANFGLDEAKQLAALFE